MRHTIKFLSVVTLLTWNTGAAAETFPGVVDLDFEVIEGSYGKLTVNGTFENDISVAVTIDYDHQERDTGRVSCACFPPVGTVIGAFFNGESMTIDFEGVENDVFILDIENVSPLIDEAFETGKATSAASMTRLPEPQ